MNLSDSRREEQAGEELVRVLRLSAVQDFLKKIFSTASGSPRRSGSSKIF